MQRGGWAPQTTEQGGLGQASLLSTWDPQATVLSVLVTALPQCKEPWVHATGHPEGSPVPWQLSQWGRGTRGHLARSETLWVILTGWWVLLAPFTW